MTLVRILGSVVGCVLLCFGVAIYIVLDIGVDPFTGIVLFFADITKKEYRIIKIIFDLTLIVIGAILGGKLGAVTLITAIAVGPTIQFFAGLIRRWRLFMVHIKGEC